MRGLPPAVLKVTTRTSSGSGGGDEACAPSSMEGRYPSRRAAAPPSGSPRPAGPALASARDVGVDEIAVGAGSDRDVSVVAKVVHAGRCEPQPQGALGLDGGRPREARPPPPAGGEDDLVA